MALIDVIVGTLPHHLGITGEPMVDGDIDAPAAMVVHLADRAASSWR